MMMAKNKVKQSFAASSLTYDRAAQLQREVGNTLLKRLDANLKSGIFLDLGCGTGFMVDELINREICEPGQIVALDIALPMLKMARNKLEKRYPTTYLCADMELLPLQSHAVDWVISNLALQWSGDLIGTFNELKRVLIPGGRLDFTTFGTHTLHELRAAWSEVDGFNHVNSFHDQGQLTDLLKQAGFLQIEMQTQVYLSSYRSVLDLMTELKQLGAHTIMVGGNKQFTSRAALQRMITAYQSQSERGQIPATFEVITVAAKT